MSDTYLVEFLSLGNQRPPAVLDGAASAYHDFETVKTHALETFRKAQAPGWGGPLIDAVRVLDEDHVILFNWTLPEEKQFQEAELQRRHEMTTALNLSLGLVDA